MHSAMLLFQFCVLSVVNGFVSSPEKRMRLQKKYMAVSDDDEFSPEAFRRLQERDFSGDALKIAVQRAKENNSPTKKKREFSSPPPRGPVGMRDRRVQAAQEPRNELNELIEKSWGVLPIFQILLRLSGIFFLFSLITYGFVDNIDTYNELLEISIGRRISLAALIGASATLASAFRLLGEWKYVADRLTDTTLYFEETGWADGFNLQKPDETAFRDLILRDQEVSPRLAVVQQAFFLCLGSASVSLASFLFFWISASSGAV
uniref:Uncharacterized protein n=1 Tax=Aureoumbra lagunensis TaxID=44058 RepID=A0A7S3NR70_9STRA|mmetsp:Transcript_2178/g.3387  ORF Transcript_2178/g.3387 Transcript_2178/m.3387 type:complete len:262 (+) Transcript_2178:48-833(+)